MYIVNINAVDGSVTINTFLLAWWLVGFATPFVIFFAYGLMAHTSNIDPQAKLAVGWGSACFFLPVWLGGLNILAVIAGWQEPPRSAAAFFAGAATGICIVTFVTMRQWRKLSREETRKEAYSH